jgi:hypothetical protein
MRPDIRPHGGITVQDGPVRLDFLTASALFWNRPLFFCTYPGNGCTALMSSLSTFLHFSFTHGIYAHFAHSLYSIIAQRTGSFAKRARPPLAVFHRISKGDIPERSAKKPYAGPAPEPQAANNARSKTRNHPRCK